MNIDTGLVSRELLNATIKGAELNEDQRKTHNLKRSFEAILNEKNEKMNEKQKKEYNKKLMDASQQMEALFIQIMLKSMKKTVHESGFFGKEVGKYLFSAEKWDAAKNEAKFLAEILELGGSGKILDLCCGVGRHALYLAEEGYEVVGLDLCETYLKEARRKTKQHGLNVKFVKSDMRNIPYENEFDGVINIFTSFGYFGDKEENQKVLNAVYKALKPGGRFVIEMMNRDSHIRNFQESSWSEIDGAYILEERTFDPYHDILYNRWIILKGDNKKEFSFHHYLYSAAKLNEMLRKAGFFVEEFFGDLQGSPLTPESKRLCALCLKKPNH